MKKDDGTRASTPEENAGVFAKHFEKLYGREASFDRRCSSRFRSVT